jgi:hypothetical protein
MRTTGHYYHSLKEYERRVGMSGKYIKNNPCIHVTGSVKGMRKQFWGYRCDVVKVGNYIYKVG